MNRQRPNQIEAQPDRARGELRGDSRLLDTSVHWFRGGLVLKAHRLVYHSTLGSRVIKRKKKG